MSLHSPFVCLVKRKSCHVVPLLLTRVNFDQTRGNTEKSDIRCDVRAWWSATENVTSMNVRSKFRKELDITRVASQSGSDLRCVRKHKCALIEKEKVGGNYKNEQNYTLPLRIVDKAPKAFFRFRFLWDIFTSLAREYTTLQRLISGSSRDLKYISHSILHRREISMKYENGKNFLME